MRSRATRVTSFCFGFGKLQSTLAILYSDHEFLDENQLLEKNDSTHGFRDGASVKLSWQEGPKFIRWAETGYELQKCYEITSRREYATLVLQNPRCSNPTTDRRRRRTLIMKERYEIILDDSKRDDRKRKCLHNSTTKLEGMPTLRMF